MLIILTGGGSCGHIFPLIAVTKELKILARERGIEDLDFLYVGPRFDTIVEEVFKREGIERRYILASKIRRYVTVLHLVDIVKFPFSIIKHYGYYFGICQMLYFQKVVTAVSR